MEKLSFPWILPTGKIVFSISFNPLINFQEINIYWKNFPFLQLNITSVQNHWRMYLLNFLNFTHREKLLFSFFSFEPICIFNFPGKRKMRNRLILYSRRPKTAKASSAQLSTRAQAAPRPQPGPGPTKCRARLGRDAGPFDLGHPSRSGGRARISLE